MMSVYPERKMKNGMTEFTRIVYKKWKKLISVVEYTLTLSNPARLKMAPVSIKTIPNVWRYDKMIMIILNTLHCMIPSSCKETRIPRGCLFPTLVVYYGYV